MTSAPGSKFFSLANFAVSSFSVYYDIGTVSNSYDFRWIAVGK